MEVAQTQRDQMQEAIKEISEVYHPYDLSNAQAAPAAEVERRLETQFARIDRVTQQAQLSDGSRSRIEKARRLIKGLVATIAFFHLQVQLWVSQLALSPEAEWVVTSELIPALYLERAAKKLSTAEQRAKVATVSETVVHNYYVTRSDGTTAAERFFGSKPADLFGWLVDHLEVPARPAAKRPKTARKAA